MVALEMKLIVPRAEKVHPVLLNIANKVNKVMKNHQLLSNFIKVL